MTKSDASIKLSQKHYSQIQRAEYRISKTCGLLSDMWILLENHQVHLESVMSPISGLYTEINHTEGT